MNWTTGPVGPSITIGLYGPAGDVGSAELTGEKGLEQYGSWDHRVRWDQLCWDIPKITETTLSLPSQVAGKSLLNGMILL